MDKRGEGSIKIFRPIFLSYSAENLPRESFTVALNSCTEKVWIRGWGGGGVSRFSVEKILSHSAEIFRRGILYCCSNFR